MSGWPIIPYCLYFSSDFDVLFFNFSFFRDESNGAKIKALSPLV